MVGRHLRAENRVLLLLHLFGVGHLLDGRGANCSLLVLALSDADGRNEGADTDSRRTEVVDLIDLEACINLVGSGENIVHLIRRDSVHAAAEGVELDHVQIVPRLDVAGSCIES